MAQYLENNTYFKWLQKKTNTASEIQIPVIKKNPFHALLTFVKA